MRSLKNIVTRLFSEFTAIIHSWFMPSIARSFSSYDYLQYATKTKSIADKDKANQIAYDIEIWLFGESRLGLELVRRAAPLRFLKNYAPLILDGCTDVHQKESGIVELRPMIEVIVTAERCLFAVYEAYNDGDRKTELRHRIYNPRIRQRLQFRFIRDREVTICDYPYAAVTHHFSEYSYYRGAPLKTFAVEMVDIPDFVKMSFDQINWS